MKNEYNICLIIVFNHKYLDNIDKLKYYYKDKFSNIYFLMPFYRGDEENVISVYESSYRFQGYFMQGYKTFFEEKNTHYVFIGDDLLLNPAINEKNIAEWFKIKFGDGYIHSLRKLKDMSQWYYERFVRADRAFRNSGVNYGSEIPTIKEAEQRALRFGLDDFCISHVKKYRKSSNIYKRIGESLLNHLVKLHISYPLLAGYSDIVIVPQECIYDFCHISGIFAAMNMFVEIAVPTALMLTCRNIVTAEDLSVIADEMWHPEIYADLIHSVCIKTEYKMQALFDVFPMEYAYLHPIKLSKWTY